MSRAQDPPWSPIVSGEPSQPGPLRAGRDGVELFVVAAGSVTLLVREIRGDGRLGSPEPLIEVGPNRLVVVPEDPAGRLLELRASHDASWIRLDPDDSPIPETTGLDDAIHPMFSSSLEREQWCESLADGTTWADFAKKLAELLAKRADDRVASADARVRERLSRLRTLDDESLSDAVKVMTSRHRATRVDRSLGHHSRAVSAILEVIDAVGVSTDEAAQLEPHPGMRAVDHVARALHLQYRSVRLEGRWWQESAGPLLAERADDGTPVALVPRRSGYLAREHREGGVRTIERITSRDASSYAETATMFYRPLPPGRSGLVGLLKLVCAGNLADLVLVVAVTAALSGLVALVPILTGRIVGTVIPTVEQVQLIFLGALLVSIAVSRALVHVVAGLAFLRLETRSSYQVIGALVDRVLQLPASFYRGRSAGDLTQRVMAVEAVRSALTQSVLSVFVSLLASLTNLGVLLHYDASMALTALVVIVCEVLLVAWLSVRMARIDYEASIAKGDLDGFGVDMLMGIRQIRIQGSRNRVLSRLFTRLGRVGEFNYRSGLLGVWVGVIVSATATLALAVVFVEFTASIREGTGTAPGTGGFVAFVTALTAFLGAVVGITPAIKAVANMVPQIRRIRPLLDAETEIGENGGDIVSIRGEVAAREVRFAYGPDLPPVLDGVDIDSRAGEFIAIVGRTGCGKSTLLSVLLGLESPQSGQVLYDGMPLQNLDAAVVRSQIGVVMQSNESLFGNIQSLILGVGSSRTIDDAWAAARLVGMEDEIDRMPMGMLTMITPSALSQSQIQRLLIARALVSRPEIIFLDEATSALDNAAQAEITETIEQLGTTRIVIAHRLSTIRNADRIYVLDHGRVVQSGTFEELQREGGMFAELMAGQVS